MRKCDALPAGAGPGDLGSLAPAALSILTTMFAERREPNVALGISGAVSGSGAAAGVLLGGLLTSSLDLCWIFFVNVPVGPWSSPSCSLGTRVSEGSDLPPSPLPDRETVDQFHAAALAAGGRTCSACSARAMMGIA